MWEGGRMRRGNLFVLFPRLHFFLFFFSSCSLVRPFLFHRENEFKWTARRLRLCNFDGSKTRRTSGKHVIFHVCSKPWKRKKKERKENSEAGLFTRTTFITGKNRCVLDLVRVNYLPLPFFHPSARTIGGHPCARELREPAEGGTYSTAQWVKFPY